MPSRKHKLEPETSFLPKVKNLQNCKAEPWFDQDIALLFNLLVWLTNEGS